MVRKKENLVHHDDDGNGGREAHLSEKMGAMFVSRLYQFHMFRSIFWKADKGEGPHGAGSDFQ